MEKHSDKKEHAENSWSQADSSEMLHDPVMQEAGMMAEQIRMRGELDKLAQENEDLKRSHDTLFRMLSENVSATAGQDIKAAVRAVLNEWKDVEGVPLATVVGPIPSMEDMVRLEKRFAEFGDLESTVVDMLGRTQALGKHVEEMAGKQKEFGDLKAKMDQINAQRAWIDSKLQSLSKQRTVVERANLEAGRLTALFWEMEEKVREIGQQNKIIAKTTDHLEALEIRLRNSQDALDRVERFESVLQESRRSVEEMGRLGEDFQIKLEEFHRSQKNIDEASNRAKEASTIVKSMDATMNTILKHNGQLDVTKKMIDGFQENLNGVDKKVEKIHKQWNAVEKLEGKIVKLEEWVKGFQQELAVASHLGDELKKVDQKVIDIRQGETELRRSMETLEAKRADLVSINALAEDARRQSELVINNLEFLKHREDEIGQVGERVDSLNRFLGQTNSRIRDVEGKLDSFGELETKMSKLESLVRETDTKIQEQVGRQPILTALRTRIDETEQMSQELEARIRDVLQHGDKVRILEGRLTDLGRMGQEVKDAQGRILEQKDAVAKQETRFRELHETHRQLVAEFEETQQKIGNENLETLAQFAGNKERLKTLQEEITAGMSAIAGHNNSIKLSEERIKKVDGFLIAMEQNMGMLEKRQSSMNALEGRIQETFKAVEEVESKMALLRNEKSVIHDARKSVESLHVLMKSVQDKIESLQAEEQLVIRTQDSVKGIVGVMGDVEDRFKALALERGTIKEAQVQIQNLRLMVDDLKTEIKNATEEEHKITDAVAKASELEFLIGEADSAIANLRRLKPKA